MRAEVIHPDVMIRQADALAADLREQLPLAQEQAAGLLTEVGCAGIGTVYLTGDGDSFHAGCAAAMAFETIGGLRCEPVSALSFLEYRAPWLRSADGARPLVIGVTASGGTQRVIQALAAARQAGAVTACVTGQPGSAVTQVTDLSMVISLPDLERSPGIRTYQASLLGLLLLAVRAGEASRRCAPDELDAVRRELAGLPTLVDATAEPARARCRELAGLIADAPVVAMVGSGPSYGTALFAAAKLMEGAGVFAAGQDLEEWHHVERWACPQDMPVFVIAPPGRSRWRAAMVAATADDQHREVIAVTPADDHEITSRARFVLPVRGQVREELSPLLYHVFVGYLAAHLATQLGRLPFRADQ
jgi:glutamine---fructose-6-phosphate transaminase (isomerizing)